MTGPELAVPPRTVRRVAFLGTPIAAVAPLRALAAAGFEIPLVVTQPDRRRGRGSRLDPSPVKEAALDLGIAVVHDPYDVVDSWVDVGVVVAYGRLLRRDLLEAVPMLNVHFSLLPRWRGAAPVERAILAGDATTGVCVMRITEGLDEGPVYACAETAIGDDESSTELTARLSHMGASLLVDVLSTGLGEPRPQGGPPTIAAKIDRSENDLDFTLPAVELHRRVRIGRAHTLFRGERLGIERSRVLSGSDLAAAQGVGSELAAGGLHLIRRPDETRSVVASAGDDTALELLTVKPAGKRAMPALDWWNGAQPQDGERLGC